MSTDTSPITTATLAAFSDAWNRHDVDTLMSFMSDDCVFQAAAGPDACGARHAGRDAVRKAFAATWAAAPDAQWRNGKHFVHMLTTSSFSNIAADYHGKGLIFGLYGFFCSPGSYGAISETFFYPDDTSVTPIGASRVWSGGSNGSTTAGPVGSTCTDLAPTTSYDVLVGANRSQGSVYYYKTAGAGSWIVTDVINDVVSTFRTGYSGVTYFVASDDTKPPGNWVLHFTNAQSWTQP